MICNFTHTLWRSLENYILSGNCAKSSHENAWYDKSKKYIDRTFGEKLTVPSGACYVRIEFSNTVEFNNIQMQLEKGSTATDFVPYVEPQTVTLPCILNAIPVESGGNVTIDGQQYIADYVDIENKKLVRMTEKYKLTGNEDSYPHSSGWIYVPIVEYEKYKLINTLCDVSNYTNDTALKTGNYHRQGISGVYFSYNDVFADINTFKAYVKANDTFVLMPLATPTITDLTDVEIQAFKDLYTYTPTTTVIASSDQLTPYMEFGLS